MALRRARRRARRAISQVWLFLDRYLVVVSSGLVAAVYVVADVYGFVLSQGTQASMGVFVGYALLKHKTDQNWRALEVEQSEMKELVESLEKSKPGSAEAIAVRKELVQLARRAQASGEEDA